jgi:ribonuclease P protein subunit POP4
VFAHCYGRFAIFKPLHDLWLRYIRELLSAGRNVEERLFVADYHGCFLTVVNAHNPTWIGVEGIVIKEACSSFHLVTKEDRLHVVGKAGCTFQYRLDDERVVTVFGDALLNRNR